MDRLIWTEATVLKTSRVVEDVANRIERAYLHRRPEWGASSLDRRLWVSAASVLIHAHTTAIGVPLDPELFVASQIRPGLASDPWLDLTHRVASVRYLTRIRQIVRSLRRELSEEIRWAEANLTKGAALEVVLFAESRRMTPLSRFLTATRKERPDLADHFREDSLEQHEACPLYRLAAQEFIANEAYPAASWDVGSPHTSDATAFHFN